MDVPAPFLAFFCATPAACCFGWMEMVMSQALSAAVLLGTGLSACQHGNYSYTAFAIELSQQMSLSADIQDPQDLKVYIAAEPHAWHR